MKIRKDNRPEEQILVDDYNESPDCAKCHRTLMLNEGCEWGEPPYICDDCINSMKDAVIKDLALLVRRLCNRCQGTQISKDAMDYIKRKNLLGTILRLDK